MAGFNTMCASAQRGGLLPRGDDANPGTVDAPIRILRRVQEIIGESGCGIELVFDADTWAGSNFAQQRHNVRPICADPDEIAIYLRAMDPDGPAVFDCTGGFPDLGVVAVAAGENGGWGIAENIQIQNCSEDGFDTNGQAGKLLTLGSPAVGITGPGNQPLRSDIGNSMTVLNGYGEATANPSLAPADDSKTTAAVHDFRPRLRNRRPPLGEGCLRVDTRPLSSHRRDRGAAFRTGAEGVDRMIVDIQNSICDDSESSFQSWKTDGESLAGLAAALVQVRDRWAAFFDDTPSFDSGGISDGIQWDGDEDLGTADDTISQEACHPGKACWQSGDRVLQEPMPKTLPEWVLGEPVDTWWLNGDPSSIGAR